MEQIIQKLKDSNIRKVKGSEVPHPEELIDLMAQFGSFKHIKSSGTINGLDDNGEDIELINNYIIEVEAKGVNNEFYGIVGILCKQGQNELTVYSGLNASACTNLHIFNSDFTKVLKGIDIEALKFMLNKANNNLNIQTPMILKTTDKMKQKIYSDDEWVYKKGQLLSTMNPSLFSYLNNAEELLRSETSLYYDMPKSDFTLLQSLTDKIKNDSVTARISKTLQLEKLFV